MERIELENGGYKEVKENRIVYCNEEGGYHRTCKDEEGLTLPARLLENGDKYWFVDGKNHRTDVDSNGNSLPAIEWNDGSKSWYVKGELHRLDGPAVEYSNGYKAWYIEGEKLTEYQFNKRIKEMNSVNDNTSNKGCSKIRSTGGDSSYYHIPVPQWFLDKIQNKGYAEVEDLGEIMYGNDFNYINVMKAQKRMYELSQGGGKKGNTIEYDGAKCHYYVDKQIEVFNREE